MKGIIDRLEGEFAVVEFEDRQMKNIKLSALPKEVKEGDVIFFSNGEWQIDKDETEKRKAEIEKLAEDLFE